MTSKWHKQILGWKSTSSDPRQPSSPVQRCWEAQRRLRWGQELGANLGHARSCVTCLRLSLVPYVPSSCPGSVRNYRYRAGKVDDSLSCVVFWCRVKEDPLLIKVVHIVWHLSWSLVREGRGRGPSVDVVPRVISLKIFPYTDCGNIYWVRVEIVPRFSWRARGWGSPSGETVQHFVKKCSIYDVVHKSDNTSD